MNNNYENLLHIQARTPDKLKEQLTSIECPSSIMSGSWSYNGSMYGVWVLLDRPVTKLSKKVFKEKLDISKQTKEF